ncbi:hypothetical protein Fot_22418 [Forsythia ovata]|uniref:Uncharacterized protein n=1 Tax=Forsythia ovata TaxID=205694 RepID=A0ABD1UXN4_9LAMI
MDPQIQFQLKPFCTLIHVLDQNDHIESVVSSSRLSLASHEEITEMHLIIAVGQAWIGGLSCKKGVNKPMQKDCLKEAIQNIPYFKVYALPIYHSLIVLLSTFLSVFFYYIYSMPRGAAIQDLRWFVCACA